jgi:hypothetical protein
MSIISKSLSGIIFNGVALTLASAPWKNNVRAIYGFNGLGNGYTVFKPTSNFNSLTQLSQDGVYIVDAATPGFELPGALLRAAIAPEAVVIGELSMQKKANGYLTIISNVTGPDQLRIGTMTVPLTGVEQRIDTDPTGQTFQDINDNDRYVYLEFLKNGAEVLTYPYPITYIR